MFHVTVFFSANSSNRQFRSGIDQVIERIIVRIKIKVFREHLFHQTRTCNVNHLADWNCLCDDPPGYTDIHQPVPSIVLS